jgi:hypothetical protein
MVNRGKKSEGMEKRRSGYRLFAVDTALSEGVRASRSAGVNLSTILMIPAPCDFYQEAFDTRVEFVAQRM